MKEKIKLIDIVNNTYQEYKSFKDIFDSKKVSKKECEDFILTHVKEGKKIDGDFEQKVKEFYSMEPKYMPELFYRQNKFIGATEVFLKTKEVGQELEKEIISTYLTLEKEAYKPKYIIEKGDFKSISKEETPDFTEEYFNMVYKGIENMIKE